MYVGNILSLMRARVTFVGLSLMWPIKRPTHPIKSALCIIVGHTESGGGRCINVLLKRQHSGRIATISYLVELAKESHEAILLIIYYSCSLQTNILAIITAR